jgi:hypothetical protein
MTYPLSMGRHITTHDNVLVDFVILVSPLGNALLYPAP